LRLQSNVRAAQVQQRIREKFGQRETVARAVRRILRLFVDWRVLLDPDRRGLYRSAHQRTIADTAVAVWVATAILVSPHNRSQSPAALLRGPHLFPFDVAVPTLQELQGCNALEVARHGLHQDVVVGLAKTDSPHGRLR